MEEVFSIKGKSKIRRPETENIFLISSSKERTLISEIDDIHLASYFQPYINFCYYILFVPFKIASDSSRNTYHIRTNTFQRILCGIIHPIICVNAFFEFRGTFVGKVRQSPEIFMRGIDRANTILMCFVFFYTVWFKRNTVLAVCNHSLPSHRKIKIKRLVTITYVIFLTYSILSYMTSVFLIGTQGYYFEKGFRQLVQKYRFQYYFAHTVDDVDEREELSPLTIIGTATAMFLRFYLWVLWDFVTSLTVMTGFVAYIVSKKFKTILTQFLDCSVEEDAQVFEAYSRTKIIFNKLNDFIGPICLAVFLITTTFNAINAFDIMDSDGWIFPIINIIYLFLSFFSMAFSAEAHYQANYFKTWLLAHPRRSFTNFLFEADQCNLAIKGDRFFILTYSFLGTTVSAVLTLTIIMVQFNGHLNSTRLPS